MSNKLKSEEAARVEGLIGQLPIAKHFQGKIATSLDEASKDKGKAVWLIIKLAALGAIGYFSWVYVLPQVFAMLGKFAAVAVTAIAAIGTIIMVPAIIGWFQRKARELKKRNIAADPFHELEKQEEGILENQEQARQAKGKIKQLENDMHLESQANSKLAGELQRKIVLNQGKAQQMQNELKRMETEYGPQTAKGMDEYVNLNADLIKILSESERVAARLTQAQNFVDKYGVRAAVMKKVGHRLTMVEALMENKVLDFRATVDILKKDYAFATKAREATDAAKKAMVFDQSWELEYALDAVTTTIAHDIAATSGNFKDITSLTANFDMDSDEMFARLDDLAGQITTGKNVTTDPKKFNHPDYKPTQDEKLKSGGFDELY